MLKSQHKILERQKQKFLLPEQLSDKNIQQFLEAVNASYMAFERDKEISSNAFLINERDYVELNDKLKIEIAIKKTIIDKLKTATKTFKNSNNIDFDLDEEDILSIVDYLEAQIKKREKIERELILAKEKAEEASKAKSDFLSIMSHEIRTPLNAVIGMTYLLQDQNPASHQLENLNVLKYSAENLLALINNILDFSKIEAGKVELEKAEFNLKQLIIDLKNSNELKALEKGNKIILTIDEKIPAVINSDSLRIGQVLNNLISNAVKFTENGIITIELRVTKITEADTFIQFSVADTGIGISADQQKYIFERFTQASSDTTRKYGGTGLGLAVTKKLLHILGSEIHVESKLSEGAKFKFNMKFENVNLLNNTEEGKIVIEHNLNQMKVLLVEDTLFNIIYASKLLVSWNANVDVAENGLIAVQKARNTNYDVILMDLQMPEMDGYTAAEQIKTFNGKVPIIALTAAATFNIKEKIMNKGMIDYLGKPFIPDDLYTKIIKHVRENSK